MKVKDILHEMNGIRGLWLATKNVEGRRTDYIRKRALEKSIKLFDEIIVYLPVEAENI